MSEEKKGLSILAFILVVAGLLVEIFHCLSDLEIFVTATGSFLPTFTYYPQYYWIIFGAGIALLLSGFIISEKLRKKELGNEKLNKVASGIFWVALLLFVVSIAAFIFAFFTRIHYF